MLSGPAILRISVLLIIAGALAALVQFLLPTAPAPPEPVPVVASPEASAPTPPVRAAPPPPTAARPAVEPGREETETRPPPRVELPADALAFPPAAPTPQAQVQARGEAEVRQAEETAAPAALAVVDLNTATVADLNRLRGGGAIGRAIAAKRPYTSVDQLLSKRVLSRAVYDRIKDQVSVR